MQYTDPDRQLQRLKDLAGQHPGFPTYASLQRAARYGVLAKNGQRIFLKHSRYGRWLYTCLADLDDFGRCVAEADVEGLATRRGDAATQPHPPNGSA